MGFKVLITDNALADLQEIVKFVAQDDAEAAIRLGNKLVSGALSLSTLPFRYPHHDKLRGIRKMTMTPYLIFYKYDEIASAIYILHIWHGARHSPNFGE